MNKFKPLPPNQIWRSSILSFALAAVLPFTALAPTSYAQTINTTSPNVLADNFSTFTYGTPGYLDLVNFDFNMDFLNTNPVWWVTLNDGPYRIYNLPCSTFTKADNTTVGRGNECLTRETIGGKDVLKFSLKGTPTFNPGEYRDIALTDTNDGFSYSLPKRWLPQVGKPVIMTTRMKWGNNYKANGTGGFLGSSGIYLWNMPADYVLGTLHAPKALGFDLISIHGRDASETLYGLAASVVTVPEPPAGQNFDYVISQFDRSQVLNVDINKWHDYKMEWSVNSDGVQKAKFWIDDHFVTQKTLPEAMPALSIEAWNDNYLVLPGTDGKFNVSVGHVEHEQNMYINSIKVFQKS